MDLNGELNQINFKVDENNLYREEGFTDARAASIRMLIPVKPDGSDDPARDRLFVGNTQLMTPQGMLPLQVPLDAKNLKDAIAEFPGAMRSAMEMMIEEAQKMQREQESRIVIPGR